MLALPPLPPKNRRVECLGDALQTRFKVLPCLMPCSNNIKGTLRFSWEIGKFTMDNSRLDLIKLDSLYIFEWRFVQSFEKVGYSETWNLWRNYFIMHILQSMFRKLTPHFYSSKSLHELANYCSMMIDILVGGFNPSEKTWSNWILSPSRGEHFKNEITT